MWKNNSIETFSLQERVLFHFLVDFSISSDLRFISIFCMMLTGSFLPKEVTS